VDDAVTVPQVFIPVGVRGLRVEPALRPFHPHSVGGEIVVAFHLVAGC